MLSAKYKIIQDMPRFGIAKSHTECGLMNAEALKVHVLPGRPEEPTGALGGSCAGKGLKASRRTNRGNTQVGHSHFESLSTNGHRAFRRRNHRLSHGARNSTKPCFVRRERSIRGRIILYFAFFILHLSFGLSWAASGLAARGEFVSDLKGLHYLSESSHDSLRFAGTNRLSVNVGNKDRKNAKVEMDLDLIGIYGQYAEAFSEMAPASLSIAGGTAPLMADLRKLYFSAFLSWADLSVGRQIVNFGKGMAFSPIDVFTYVDLYDLTFRRRGSDAVRGLLPLGEMSGADVVVELPGAGRDHVSAVKLYGNAKDFDISGIGIYRHQSREAIGGITFKGDAVAGIKGELVEHYRRNAENWSFEAMFGADYSWTSTYVLMAEYMYKQKPDPLVASFYDTHNAFMSFQYMINEITNASLSILAAMPKETAMVTAQFYRNVLQNVDTIFYARVTDLKISRISVPDVEYAIRAAVKF